MHWILVLIAIIVTVIGAASLNQATLGVGLIGIACLIGILARIVQASKEW
ncbi:MAG: hypothetical protein HYX82_03585 [Chloroflexi bacterium]|nr:hypothetical protein [Chloroflexota bacterium]